MEENNDQPMPTTPTRIHTDTKITGTYPTINVPIPNLNGRNGTIKIPPRRPLQIPPRRHKQQTPTGQETQVHVSGPRDQPQPILNLP